MTAIIYPFNDTLIPIIPHLALPDFGESMLKVIDANRKYLHGKDIGYIKNQPDTQICISDNLVDELKLCDVLIYMDENHEAISDDIAIVDMQKAIRLQKKVICLRNLPGDKVKELSELAATIETEFHYLCNDVQNQERFVNYEIPFELYSPSASIIMVGETLEGLEGEHICLSVADEMEAMGYHCVTVLESKYTQVLNAIPYPSFLRAGKSIESEKVYYLNNFLRKIDEIENPDVIILHLPDPMMKYNQMFCNGFGIIPYLVSQAILPDCFILCTQFEDVEAKFFDSLSANFENRFGYGIDFIHMSNMMFDIAISRATGKKKVSYYPQSKLDLLLCERFKDSCIPIFNGMNKEQCVRLVKAVMDMLASYNENSSVLV